MPVPVYCDVPLRPDTGSVYPPKAYYLVMGRDVPKPGAYFSWESAQPQYKNKSFATVKKYMSHEWDALESAWHGGCERGEHEHPASSEHPTPTAPKTAPVTPPRPARTQLAMSAPSQRPIRTVTPLRIIDINSRSPSPSPTQTKFDGRGPSTSPTTARVACDIRSPQPKSGPPLQSSSPAGQPSYAVRVNGVGQVHDEFEPAREYYHQLQNMGYHPVMSIGRSLTSAVNFIEERSSQERCEWIAEEVRAFEAWQRDTCGSQRGSSAGLDESDFEGTESGAASPVGLQ
ncbi:hypothetical protein GGX14DRAFT_579392 [Mycena pura]|uniref:Uncharacterized protein n=1 Tax=Mycena pura TaxID=153505 RepID=A0AAD6Y238_9AGAR|nr:hypothetical protein GGX14DRAFT_579392 [Mycena pura]